MLRDFRLEGRGFATPSWLRHGKLFCRMSTVNRESLGFNILSLMKQRHKLQHLRWAGLFVLRHATFVRALACRRASEEQRATALLPET